MKPPHSRGPGRPPEDRGPSRGPGFGSGQRSHGPARHGGADRSDRPRHAEGRGPGAADRSTARPDRAGPDHGHGAPPDRDRPAQGSDRPRSDWSRSDRPRSERPRSDRPRSDRPYAAADRAAAERPYQERHDAPRREDHDGPRNRPQPTRPHGNRPHGDRPHGDRPSGDRPHGDRRFRDDRPRAPARAEEPVFDTPRAPHTASGGVWLYGQHAVAAALANPSRRLRRLMLTEEAEAALIPQVPPPWALQPERVDRGRIDQLLGHDAVHQGAALLADPLAPPSLAALLERPGPVLVLDQVTDPRNVGAILRCAAAFGAAGIITQDRNAPEETGSLAKAASGALETVPLLRAVNIARTLVALKAANLWVVGLDAAGPAALSGASFAGRRVALVLGAEGSGLRRLTRETCDELAGLATTGAMAHLNVAAATAVALYELTRPA